MAALAVSLWVLPATAEQAPAGEDTSMDVKSYDGWTFQAIPYVWLPEIHGSVQIRDLSASVNADLGKMLDLLWNGQMYAVMGHFEAKNRGLSLFIDTIGGSIRPETHGQFARTKTTLNFTFIEFGPAYRILDVPSAKPGGRPILIDALIGGRFMYFYDSITVTGNEGRVQRKAIATSDWVDPFVGGRFFVPLAGPVDIVFRGDIGGFDLGSQLAWNVIAGFQADLPWHPGEARTTFTAAYKVLDFDRSTGSGNRQVSTSLDMRGPAIGLGFEF